MATPTASDRSAAAFCAACGAALSTGARFCHRCGTPVGQGAPVVRQGGGGAAATLPWGVAFVALLALVAMVAGRNFGKAKGSAVDGSANALPTTALDSRAAGQAGPAPNIANLSPSERASRLYIRIMELAESGKVDSVAFFAPMALAAHEMLEAPTPDERYHLGRIAEVAGVADIATAQADTILRQSRTQLLGLVLAARAARMRGDSAAARAFDQRLLAALQAELASGNPDYELHRSEIDRAVADARRP
jgi:hypothetical protein